MSEQLKLLKARRKVCFSIAECIDLHFDGKPFDIDEAAKLIECFLPHTYAEAEAEMDAILRSPSVQSTERKPSFFDQLRLAVHATEGMSIRCVVEAAVAKIAQVTALTAERDELHNENIVLKNGYKAATAERDKLQGLLRNF